MLAHERRPSVGPRRLVRLVAGFAGVVLVLTGPGALALPVGPPDDPGLTGPQQVGDVGDDDGERLEGLFGVDPGQCEDEGVTSGSYFRMVTPGGDPETGPYVDNGDSPCGDESYTPLEAGTDGGLLTTEYQPHPDPAFDGGDGVNDRLTQPQSFHGTDFSTATNPTDPQTEEDVPVPSVTHADGELSGDVRAFAAAWNGQHFNQGSPKPSGERPGNTAGPEGTYDPDTGRYTLTWASQIEGGPFNNFTGVWHLEGTFEEQGDGVTAATDSQPGAEPASAGDGPDPAPADGGAPAAPADDTAPAAAADGGTTPRTGAPVAVSVGLLLVALAGVLRWAALRAESGG